jgi:hypothetical protein
MTDFHCLVGANLWIPSEILPVVREHIPLVDLVEIDNGTIYKASTEESGKIKNMRELLVLVRIGHWKTISDPRETTGAYGFVSKGDHSMYTHGLMFTTYRETDVAYVLGSRTVTKKYKIDRLEVLSPDGGLNLDDFVANCVPTYAKLGLKRQERENHLLFYRLQRKTA